MVSVILIKMVIAIWYGWIWVEPRSWPQSNCRGGSLWEVYGPTFYQKNICLLKFPLLAPAQFWVLKWSVSPQLKQPLKYTGNWLRYLWSLSKGCSRPLSGCFFVSICSPAVRLLPWEYWLIVWSAIELPCRYAKYDSRDTWSGSQFPCVPKFVQRLCVVFILRNSSFNVSVRLFKTLTLLEACWLRSRKCVNLESFCC